MTALFTQNDPLWPSKDDPLIYYLISPCVVKRATVFISKVKSGWHVDHFCGLGWDLYAIQYEVTHSSAVLFWSYTWWVVLHRLKALIPESPWAITVTYQIASVSVNFNLCERCLCSVCNVWIKWPLSLSLCNMTDLTEVYNSNCSHGPYCKAGGVAAVVKKHTQTPLTLPE